MMIITAQTLATAHVGVWSSFLVVALLSVAALTATPPKTPVKDRPNSAFILLKQTQRKQSRDEWVIKMKGLFGLKWKKMEVYVKRERERGRIDNKPKSTALLCLHRGTPLLLQNLTGKEEKRDLKDEGIFFRVLEIKIKEMNV